MKLGGDQKATLKLRAQVSSPGSNTFAHVGNSNV
jgi:hypothetical protein